MERKNPLLAAGLPPEETAARPDVPLDCVREWAE